MLTVFLKTLAMTADSCSWRWQSSIAIALVLSGSAVCASGRMVSAQMIPDHTLGAESSVVTPDTIKGMESDRISGGAVRGSNLFHSFREFNIGEGRGGYFENPAAIENIFSRVTGSNPSEILGTLGVLGKANLFFLNPNGILFGPNARLDVRGSFLATTADRILFPDGRQFSATNPEAPPILTVNVQQPIGLEFEGKEGTITNQGFLVVNSGQNLALVGGNLMIDSGVLAAPGGRVELGGLIEAGTIGLHKNGSLGFPNGLARADVSLTKNAVVDVRAGGGGFITVNAENLELREGSQLLAGIEEGMGTSDAQAGDIEIDATDTVFVEGIINRGGTSIANDVKENSIGNAGGISITAGSLLVTNGAQLSATTFGVGDAGGVNITATEKVLFDGVGENLLGPGGASSRVETGARGEAGGISITTSALNVINGAILSASTRGEGNAGTVKIQAESVVFDGEDSDGFGSGAFSQVGSMGQGNGGGISITTSFLKVINGAELAVSTLGEGNAGAVNITATETVLFDGETSIGLNSGVFSLVDSMARGNAGNISIITGSLEVTNGATVSSSTFGEGNAGSVIIRAADSVVFDGKGRRFLSNASAIAVGTGDAGSLTITTRQLLAKDGGQVQATTFGSGKGGNLTVNATESVQLIGFLKTADDRFFPSGLFTSTQGLGDAGDLTIATKVLLVRDGAEVQASSTFGSGDGGNLTVNATESVQLIGSADNGRLGGLFTQTRGAGKAGDMTIVTGQLLVQNESNVSAVTADDGGGSITVKAHTLEITSGGQLRTTTEGIANAGNIALFVPDHMTLSGSDSGVFANTKEESSGNGGNILIDPNTVIISDGAQIAVNSEGSGIGGDINLQAGSLTLDQGTITAETASNQGGNINLTLSALLTLRNDSQITATAGTAQAGGDGGNITIDAPFVIAFPNEDSNIQANAFEGGGGNITINTNGLFGIEFRDQETPLSDITASSEFGQPGAVEINPSAVDPTRGLDNLPQETVEAKVAQGCQTVGGQATLAFFDIGRGGLPPSPDALFSSEIVIAEWIPLGLTDEKTQAPTSEKRFTGDDLNNITLLTTFPCQSN